MSILLFFRRISKKTRKRKMCETCCSNDRKDHLNEAPILILLILLILGVPFLLTAEIGLRRRARSMRCRLRADCRMLHASKRLTTISMSSAKRRSGRGWRGNMNQGAPW
jgi:hypothetical protein